MLAPFLSRGRNSLFTCLVAVSLLAIAGMPAVQAQAPALPADMTTTESGLEYAITSPGHGPAAKPGQVVIVHYVGTFMDGSLLDSSRKRGQPFAFTLGMGRVIRGWDEGFALLRENRPARPRDPKLRAIAGPRSEEHQRREETRRAEASQVSSGAWTGRQDLKAAEFGQDGRIGRMRAANQSS